MWKHRKRARVSLTHHSGARNHGRIRKHSHGEGVESSLVHDKQEQTVSSRVVAVSTAAATQVKGGRERRSGGDLRTRIALMPSRSQKPSRCGRPLQTRQPQLFLSTDLATVRTRTCDAAGQKRRREQARRRRWGRMPRAMRTSSPAEP